MTQVISTQPTAKDGKEDNTRIQRQNTQVYEETCLNFCCELFFCEDFNPPKPKKKEDPKKKGKDEQVNPWVALSKLVADEKK